MKETAFSHVVRVSNVINDLNLPATWESFNVISQNLSLLSKKQQLYVLQATYPNLLVIKIRRNRSPDFLDYYPLNIPQPSMHLTNIDFEIREAIYTFKILYPGLILVHGNIKYHENFLITLFSFLDNVGTSKDLLNFNLYIENGYVWLTDHNISMPISWYTHMVFPHHNHIHFLLMEYLSKS